MVGEIVITESMVTASPDLKGLKLDAFTKSARQLRKLTDELQDVSMSLRMVSVSGTFQKMNRIVRDMCKKLGKQARLTLVGEDTEVDKTIVDSIGDPIMHIVRNSMDHGIEETAEERIAAGKDPVGEIVLSARHTGSEVIIEIPDDGQGVNYDAVLNKAIRNGSGPARRGVFPQGHSELPHGPRLLHQHRGHRVLRPRRGHGRGEEKRGGGGRHRLHLPASRARA